MLGTGRFHLVVVVVVFFFSGLLIPLHSWTRFNHAQLLRAGLFFLRVTLILVVPKDGQLRERNRP